MDAPDDLRAQYRARLWHASLDVTDTPAIRLVVGNAFTSLGRIDVIVNNAGYGLFGTPEEVSDEQIRRQIDTNLVGLIFRAGGRRTIHTEPPLPEGATYI